MSISITGLILCICLYPFVLIMYVLLKNEAEAKNGIYFGVTIPKEYRKAEELERIKECYQKQMKRSLWLMLVFPVPSLFLPWESIVTAVWMLWMTISIFIFFVPFGIANGKLKEIKQEKGWGEAGSTDLEAEIKSAGKIRCVKWFHFLPQNAVAIVLTIWSVIGEFGSRSQALIVSMATFAGVSLLFWGMAVWMDRQKTQIISSDSDVNVNYNRAKKNLYKNFWVILAWATVFYMVWMLFCVDINGAFTSRFWWATGVYSVMTAILAVCLMRKKASLDKIYESKRDKRTSEDNDENWIWGMLYYNPRDKHSMVEKRVGVGTTVNMATGGGKAMVAFAGLTLLSLPIISIWIIMLEFTPIQLVADADRVVANHLREEYVISMPVIEDAELLNELPKMSRNSGTAMENLKKGSWSVAEEGNCTVFLNPENDVFLRIETPSRRYYLSGADDEETKAVYEAIQAWQSQVSPK
nr:hypothetical protein [Lachnospiraceae bacterium]